MRMILCCVASIILGELLSPAHAQTRFEVASIHPSGPGASPQSARIALNGDSFDATDSTVGDILDMLNGWQLHRVVGGPTWMTTDRYDLHAKASGPVPPNELKNAVMALLGERLKLTAHHENRDISAMVLLPPDKSAKIKPAAEGETYSVPYFAHNELTFTAVPISAFTNYLSNVWHLPVMDQTGLSGAFDFTLNPSRAPEESWGDQIHEAMAAIGLKIEERKVPTEVTVIDHCERPSEN